MIEKKKSLWPALPLVILLAALLCATAAMFGQALRYDESRGWSDGRLGGVAIEGTYSEEGGPWQPLTREAEFDYLELRSITARGHFTGDIPAGEKRYFNICQLWVTLRVNGQEVFRFGPQEGDGNPAQSIGNMWVSFTSPGITTDDVVELSFGNLYRNAYFIQFDNLLWHMYTGSEQAMLVRAINKDAGLLFMGVVFLVLTLFLAITGVLLALLRIRGVGQFLCLGLSTFFTAAWFITLAPASSLLIPFPVFLNTLYAYSIQGIAGFIILFATANLSGLRKRGMLAAMGVLMAAMLVAIRLQMTGTRDMFSTIDYFSTLDSIIALMLVVCLVYEIRVLKNQKLMTFFKAMLPLVVLGVAEMLNGIWQLLEAGICFGLGLFLFTVLEGYFILRRIRQSMEAEKRAAAMETELAQGRISVMLSQIQPHFLYNALVGIQELCDTKPEVASAALEHFSYFLRGNLDALTNTALIPFEKELEHVEDYLYLEKMRYDERLNIRWEITCKDFVLPPLTLQSMVENAVRYGITKKNGGGSLCIRSERVGEQVVITVGDDGVGFDVNAPKEDGRSHTGISGVRSRLETMCGGSLCVTSQPGAGTQVKILLPQKEMAAV